jgi:uncharacterized membrane protein YfcA
MQIAEAFLLWGVAALAGAVNAVAGGGTVLTFPALLFCGVPALVANATSTTALVVGTAGSIFGFRRQLEAVRPWLWRLGPVSLVGGGVGSFFLTSTSERQFLAVVPVLLLFATALFLAQGFLRSWMVRGRRGQSLGRWGIGGAMVFQFLVAVYGGYFGAGIGILMLASLGLAGPADLHEANALKNVLSCGINLVAALWLGVGGWVDWPRVGVMSFGAGMGYFLGAHFSQKVSPSRVRQLIAGVSLTLSLWMFLRSAGP